MIRERTGAKIVCGLMDPPLSEIYVAWHPDDVEGAANGSTLIEHPHGTALTGLVGEAIEVFERSVGRSDKAGASV